MAGRFQSRRHKGTIDISSDESFELIGAISNTMQHRHSERSYVCSKGLAIETSVIHSHFTPALSWCLSTETLSGASKRQKHTLTSLLNIMFTCVTPNSSRGELLNSFI